MKMRWNDGVLLVILALVEVVLIEVLIRVGAVGVERAAGALFVLVVLNGALVAGIGRLRTRRR